MVGSHAWLLHGPDRGLFSGLLCKTEMVGGGAVVWQQQCTSMLQSGPADVLLDVHPAAESQCGRHDVSLRTAALLLLLRSNWHACCANVNSPLFTAEQNSGHY